MKRVRVRMRLRKGSRNWECGQWEVVGRAKGMIIVEMRGDMGRGEGGREGGG